MSFEAIPPELAGLKQFCLRKGKQPYTKDRATGRYVAQDWQLERDQWLSLPESLADLAAGTNVFHDGMPGPAEGIGILIVGDGQAGPQLLGGDLDACRDPETGEATAWAKSQLEGIRPFYTEVSPSKTGFRFFVKGKLPGNQYFVTGAGPQTGISPEMIDHIIKAKPIVGKKIKANEEKIQKGEKADPVFNGLEFHESNEPKSKDSQARAKHLTITGDRIPEYCYPYEEDRTEAIKATLAAPDTVLIDHKKKEADRQAAVEKYLKGGQGAGARPGSDQMPGWAADMSEEANKNRLPHLDILKVAELAGFEEFDRTGDQIRGSIPKFYPSTSGHNIVIDPAENHYCNMHHDCRAGGDPWVWLAHECGAVPWEEAGAGALKDPVVFEKTIRYAIEKGYVKAEDIPARQKTALQPVEWAKGVFVGLDGCTRQGEEGKDGQKVSGKISDGYAYLAAILEDYEQSPPERYFVIRGKPISAANEFEITAKISDFGDSRTAKKILLTLWAEDRLGKMDIDVIKVLSPKPVKHIRILNRPAWIDGELVAPGLAATETRFNYARKVCVDFSETGDLAAGRDALIKALLAFDPKNAAILFATVLGAPIIARCWPGDRYCLFIQGTTQTKKTSALTVFMSMYGRNYSKESFLVRWGDGATGNAIEHIAAKTGPFPFPLDNYKQYSDKDPAALQKLIHAVVEGTEKDRLNRDSSLRAADEYQCSLIVTGEQFPGQDAATRARIIELLWSDAIHLEYLTEAQAHIEDINAFGKAWLQWLNSETGQAVMGDHAARFDEARLHYLKAANNPGNAGRLASNAAVVALVWEIFNQWEEGHELAEKFYPVIKAAIDEHVLNASADISDQLDGEKFITWLRAELLVGRYYLAGKDAPLLGMSSEQIGHFRPASANNQEADEVLIDPAVLSAKLLPAWQRTTNGTKTDKKALLRQLVGLGYLQYDEVNKRYAINRRVEGKTVRIHAFLKVFNEAQPVRDEGVTIPPVTENRDQAKGETGKTGETGPKGKVCKEGKNSDESITNLNDSSRIDTKGKEDTDNIDTNTSYTGYTGYTKSIDTGSDVTGEVTGVANELPDNIRLKLKKMPRKDSTGRQGLAVSDLEPGELEYLHGAGWTEGTIEASGIKVLWAPKDWPETATT